MSKQISIPRAQTAPGWRRTALWVVTILVALAFLAAGLAKLAGAQMMTNVFDSPTDSKRIQQTINEEKPMTRIPTHTVEDAPEASRALLQKIAQSSPAGRPLNLHAQMAHSPAVLAAYTSLRAVIAQHGTFDPKVSAALTLATATAVGNDYMIGLAGRLARMNGWTEEQVAALRRGTTTGDAKLDALTGLVREAAANSGKVTDATWKAAQQAGWSDEQLTEAFAYLGLTVFTGYFLNYAQTDLDI